MKQTKVLFRNSDIDKYTVNKEKSVENLINSSFNAMLENKYTSSRLGDSFIKERKISNESFNKLKNSDSNPINRNFRLVFRDSSIIENNNLIEGTNTNIINNKNEIPPKFRSSKNFNISSVNFNLNSNITNENEKLKDKDNNIIDYRNSPKNLFRNSFFALAGNLNSGVSSLNNNKCSTVNNFNDISITNMQLEAGGMNTTTDKVKLGPRPILTQNKMPKVTPPQLFRRFTFKILGKDEHGNDNNIVLNSKDEVLGHDLDNSIDSGMDKKLLDEMFENSFYCDDIDEVYLSI